MGGAKARHLLSKILDSNSHIEREAWKKVCDVTTYRKKCKNKYQYVHKGYIKRDHHPWFYNGTKKEERRKKKEKKDPKSNDSLNRFSFIS